MIVMLGKPHGFRKRPSCRYTVYVWYHRSVQQCYSESRSLAFSGLRSQLFIIVGTVRDKAYTSSTTHSLTLPNVVIASATLCQGFIERPTQRLTCSG